MSEPTPEPNKVQALEGLRGVMAWWVVLGHISLTFGWNLPLIDRNTLAVDVFIILSGFVISGLIDRKQEPYLPYILRRAFRLGPLYFAVLFLSALLIGVQLDAWTHIPFATAQNQNRIELADEAVENFPAHLAVHATLLHGLVPKALLPDAAFTLVGQAWSISLEWQFYLVAPFLLIAFRSAKTSVTAVAVMVALVLASRYFSSAFLGTKIILFSVGITSYLAVSRRGRQRFILVLLAGSIAGSLIVYGYWQAIPLLVWFGSLIATIVSPTHPLNRIARLLGSKIAVGQGQISYSIYLVHMLPLTIVVATLNGIGVPRDVYPFVTVGLTVPAILLLAMLSYRYIEAPGVALGARVTRLLLKSSRASA
jgi:peptidoglycan/LPS O-acetylase OafA/YrhL